MNLYFISESRRFDSLGESLYKYLNNKGIVENFKCVEKFKELKNVNPNDLVYSNYFIDPFFCKLKAIAPNYRITKFWDSKINQYNELFDTIKVPNYSVYKNIFNVLQNKLNNNAFITCEFGSGGKFSYIYKNKNPLSIYQKFKTVRGKRIRVSEYVDIKQEISCHVIIFKESIVLGPMIECGFENFVEFNSIEYPANITKDIFEEIKMSLYSIAKKVRSSGYLGVLGIDLMIDQNSKINLVELNPRKMGSSTIDSIILESNFGISLSVLEYKSTIEENINLPELPLNCGFTGKMYMSNYDPSVIVTNMPGDEVDKIKSKNEFSLSYVDQYNGTKDNPNRIFNIKGKLFI